MGGGVAKEAEMEDKEGVLQLVCSCVSVFLYIARLFFNPSTENGLEYFICLHTYMRAYNRNCLLVCSYFNIGFEEELN